MGRKEITTKEDLMKVIELFENTGITYWFRAVGYRDIWRQCFELIVDECCF